MSDQQSKIEEAIKKMRAAGIDPADLSKIAGGVGGASAMQEYIKTLGKFGGELTEKMRADGHASAHKELYGHGDPIQRMIGHIAAVTNMDMNAKDPYGNGDQSDVKADMPSQVGYRLRDVWSQGGDYNPMNPTGSSSSFCKSCFTADLPAVTCMLSAMNDKAKMEILERRESLLRIPPVLSVIIGARTMGDRAVGSHYAVMQLLLKSKASVHCKDIAGYTVIHHCATQFASASSLSLIPLLISHGANPNILNRFGVPPLSEAIMCNKKHVVQALLDAGSDPWQKDRSGSDGFSLSRALPDITSLLSRAGMINSFSGSSVTLHGLTSEGLNGQKGKCGGNAGNGRLEVTLDSGRVIAVKPENLKLVKQERTCSYLGCTRVDKSKMSICQGCLSVRYCCRDCQKSDWSDHKALCKAKQCVSVARIDLTPMIYPNDITSNVYNFAKQTVTTQTETEEKSGKKTDTKDRRFIVKIQVVLGTNIVGTQADMMLYNKDRSVMCSVKSSNPHYQVIDQQVRNKGVGGAKGYFNATINSDDRLTLLVETATLLPAQPW